MTQTTETPKLSKDPAAPLSAFDEAAKLRAENEQLRQRLVEAEARKIFPPPKPGADLNMAPSWFRCHLQQLPVHLAVHVLARSEEEAKRTYCERMGVIWDSVNDAPLSGDRLVVQQTTRPPAKLMRGRYTRAELIGLKFEERELDEAAI